MKHVKLMILADSEEHEVPEGWFVLTAVPLRTTGVVHATVALILQEIGTRRKLTVDDYQEEVAKES